MATFPQRSFAGGEISPALQGRSDLPRVAAGARTVRNLVVRKDGAVTTRDGTRYVGEVADSNNGAVLIPFVFGIDQSLMLVLGDYCMRWIDGDDWLRLTLVPPWADYTEYSVSNVVSHEGTMYYCLVAHDEEHEPPHSTYWYPLEEDILEIPTPWSVLEATEVAYAQSADVVIFAHRGHIQHRLSRHSPQEWILNPISFVPPISRPNQGTATEGAGGSRTFRYQVTAIDANGAESLPGCEESRECVRDRGVVPWEVTCTGHPYQTGDQIVFLHDDLDFDASLDSGEIYTITRTGSNTFTLDGTTLPIFYGPYIRQIARPYLRTTGSAIPTASDPNELAWPAVSGAVKYAVYKEYFGIYGFVGYATGNSFDDINITPDTSDTPPTRQSIFNVGGKYPSAVALVQQRLAFANSDSALETTWLSRIGDYFNFSQSDSIDDSAAITFTIAANQVNEIRHLVEVGRLLIFTAGGIWSVEGDADGVIRPTTLNLRRQVYSGSSNLRPLVVVNSALYVQARGSIVRDLGFSFQDDGFRSTDLTSFAGHLVAGYTVVDWCYQENPNSIVWVVRDDGVLLGLTYIREQEIVAWHRHDTQGGFVERVACIPRDGEDVVYIVVRREIDGEAVRYVERLVSRPAGAGQDELFTVDCGLSYDGANATANSLTLTGSGWTPDDDLTLTASASLFDPDEVGNLYVLRIGDASVSCVVTGYTSVTVVTVRPDIDVPVALRAVATGDWSRAVDEIQGLEHLEGERVAILADGSVVSDGSDDAYVVEDGAVTLDRPYSVIHVGLPITAELELLEVADLEGGALADRRVLVDQATLLVEASAAPLVGPDAEHLRAVRAPAPVAQGDPPPLHTGTFIQQLDASWNDHGRLLIRHADPTPLTLLGVIRRGRAEKAPG